MSEACRYMSEACRYMSEVCRYMSDVCLYMYGSMGSRIYITTYGYRSVYTKAVQCPVYKLKSDQITHVGFIRNFRPKEFHKIDPSSTTSFRSSRSGSPSSSSPSCSRRRWVQIFSPGGQCYKNIYLPIFSKNIGDYVYLL
jgi:hypothetical protein